jgi:hypothetical protein
MKPNKLISVAIYAIYSAISLSGRAQGTFENLGFESANVPPSGLEPYPNFVPTGSALPDWAGYLGADQQTQVGYNATTLGTATISLIGPTWDASDTSSTSVGIIDGNYSVLLQSGNVPGSGVLGENASIEQNGTVPLTAESLQFEALAVGPFSVSFAGNALNPIALSSGVSADGLPYTVYGASISAWSGQSGTLEFTANYNVHDPYVVLDDISFSTQAIPESSPLALTGIGALVFALYRRFAPKRP